MFGKWPEMDGELINGREGVFDEGTQPGWAWLIRY